MFFQDLTVQKELTESELKEEIIARRDAERRLRNAEESLQRLEAALQESHPSANTEKPTELEKEIFHNVASLKSKESSKSLNQRESL